MSDSVFRPGAASEVLDALSRCLDDLTPELRKAATHVLENANLISVSSVREMAGRADVKPNTLVRMARALGFEGYEDFRKPFREQIINGPEQFPDRARWLQSLSKGGRLSGLYTEIATTAIGNIERVFTDTTARAVKIAADDICKAQSTYVLGIEVLHPIAHHFSYLANSALGSVTTLPRDGLPLIESLVQAGRRDVLVAMAIKPYRRDVAEAVEQAASQSVKVIGIADSPAAPILARATHRFVLPSDTTQFFPSTVALMALLEALLAFVIAGAGPEAVGKIEDLQRRRQELGVYLGDDERL